MKKFLFILLFVLLILVILPIGTKKLEDYIVNHIISELKQKHSLIVNMKSYSVSVLRGKLNVNGLDIKIQDKDKLISLLNADKFSINLSYRHLLRKHLNINNIFIKGTTLKISSDFSTKMLAGAVYLPELKKEFIENPELFKEYLKSNKQNIKQETVENAGIEKKKDLEFKVSLDKFILENANIVVENNITFNIDELVVSNILYDKNVSFKRSVFYLESNVLDIKDNPAGEIKIKSVFDYNKDKFDIYDSHIFVKDFELSVLEYLFPNQGFDFTGKLSIDSNVNRQKDKVNIFSEINLDNIIYNSRKIEGLRDFFIQNKNIYFTVDAKDIFNDIKAEIKTNNIFYKNPKPAFLKSINLPDLILGLYFKKGEKIPEIEKIYIKEPDFVIERLPKTRSSRDKSPTAAAVFLLVKQMNIENGVVRFVDKTLRVPRLFIFDQLKFNLTNNSEEKPNFDFYVHLKNTQAFISSKGIFNIDVNNVNFELNTQIQNIPIRMLEGYYSDKIGPIIDYGFMSVRSRGKGENNQAYFIQDVKISTLKFNQRASEQKEILGMNYNEIAELLMNKNNELQFSFPLYAKIENSKFKWKAGMDEAIINALKQTLQKDISVLFKVGRKLLEGEGSEQDITNIKQIGKGLEKQFKGFLKQLKGE